MKTTKVILFSVWVGKEGDIGCVFRTGVLLTVDLIAMKVLALLVFSLLELAPTAY